MSKTLPLNKNRADQDDWYVDPEFIKEVHQDLGDDFGRVDWEDIDYVCEILVKKGYIKVNTEEQEDES